MGLGADGEAVGMVLVDWCVGWRGLLIRGLDATGKQSLR